MNATISVGKDKHSVSADGSIGSAFETIGGLPDTYIFLVNGTPVSMDTPIADGMDIKAVKVASGG
ncbi:MAG: hypothetical protein LBT41_04835 [Candidatus Methanoplasma sp.]|jgi:sulfur carrier protein|nr:hypothetical protein [Candidatus Methanoplasma sp.]